MMLSTALSSPPRMQDFTFDHFLSSINGYQNSAQFSTAPSASSASQLQTQHQLAGIYTISLVDTGPLLVPRPGHQSPDYGHHTQHNERQVGGSREASGCASAEASQCINQISVYQAQAQVSPAGPAPSPTRAHAQASPQYIYHQQDNVSIMICGLGLVHMLSSLHSNETSEQHSTLYRALPQQQKHQDVPNYAQTLCTSVNFDALGGKYSYIPEYTACFSLSTTSECTAKRLNATRTFFLSVRSTVTKATEPSKSPARFLMVQRINSLEGSESTSVILGAS
jgi:hypothetical protein